MCRESIRRTALAVIWLVVVSHAAAQITEWEIRGLENGTHPFVLRQLPYALDALEPHINAKTMKLQREYHAECVTNLNKSIGREFSFYVKWYNDGFKKPPQPPGWDAYGEWLEEMLNDPSSVPESIRGLVGANGGSHYNHTLFWQMMKKDGGGEPKGELAASLKKQFGSFLNFRGKFTQSAIGQPGDGWTWLTLDGASLRIESLPGEETPLSRGRQVLLGIDVWEHAYQAQYGTNRAAYVAGWFHIVNWDFVANRYSELKLKR